MTKKNRKCTIRQSSKVKRAEDLAKILGVSASAVWAWRRDGSLPKNARIRAEYLRATK